jgi:hypothetical protein
VERLRPLPVAAFCGLTLLIWTNRIWLAWTNDEDTVAEKLVWSLPITLFVVAALVIGVAMLRGTDRDQRWFVVAVRAFAAGTVAYWAIRLPFIWANDHGLSDDEEIGFKVVHTVLAVVSVVPAALAWRSVDGGAPRPGGHVPRSDRAASVRVRSAEPGG